jgi:hypothetical protein
MDPFMARLDAVLRTSLDGSGRFFGGGGLVACPAVIRMNTHH